MAAYRTTTEVVDAADTTLQTARFGLEDYKTGTSHPRRMAGLRNVIVWGRPVTNILQKLRTFSTVAFDQWYEPRQAFLKAKPVPRSVISPPIYLGTMWDSRGGPPTLDLAAAARLIDIVGAEFERVGASLRSEIDEAAPTVSSLASTRDGPLSPQGEA